MHTPTDGSPRAFARPMAGVMLVLGFVAALLGLVGTGGAPVEGAPLLTVSTLTWGVIGLDSNRPADGPDLFPVGVRVCNTGTSAADDVAARLVWDSANSYLSISGASTIALGSVAAGGCADAYFNVAVQPTKSAHRTTRRYHVEVTNSGVLATSTPTPRELFVEELVSQNRNSIDAITGPGGLLDPPATTVYVGQTYTYQLHGSTATNGYEQLEAFLDFPNIIFRVRSVRATYTEPAGGSNDRPYADACGWDEVPTSGTYRSCIGPELFGGKAGGGIVLTYEVLVLSAGTATVSGLIYDFSGSSYHYNSDAGVDTVSIVALDPPPPTTTTTTVPPTTTTTTTVPPTTTTTVPPTTTTTTVPPTTTTTTTVPTTTTTTTTTVPPTTTTTTTTTTTVSPTTTTTTVPTTTTTTTVPPTTTTTTVPPTTTTTTVPPTTTTTTVPPTTTTTTVPPTTTTTTVPPTTTTTTVPPTTTTTTVPPTTTTTTVPPTTTTTTVPPTTTTTVPPPTSAPVATIDRVQLAPVCVSDTPYIDYVIEVSNTPATTATLSFFDLDGALVQRLSGLALTGRVLYPGASVEPPDWPGWALVGGTWVPDVSDARWRDGLEVVIEVNPTASGSVSYPPATAACNGPVVGTSPQPEALFEPAPTTTGAARAETSDQLVRGGTTPTSTAVGPRLPATGASQRPDRVATLAAVVVLVGAVLALVARRPRTTRSS